MNINTIHSDIRKFFYSYLDRHSLLKGRIICRQWKSEIESLDVLWKSLEGYAFAEFKESSRIKANIRNNRFCKFQHEFPYSFDKRSFLVVGKILIRVVGVWDVRNNKMCCGLDTLNTETNEYKTTNVFLPFECSPNLQEIHDRGMVDIPNRSYFTKAPDLRFYSDDFVCLVRAPHISIWNIKTLQCIFFQPNFARGQFNAKNGIGYVTINNQMQIWDPINKNLLYSYSFKGEVSDLYHQVEDWVVLKQAHTEHRYVFNVSQKMLQHIIETPVFQHYIFKGKLLYVHLDNRLLNIICLNSGKNLFTTKAPGIARDGIFAVLENNILEIWNIDTIQRLHQLPIKNTQSLQDIAYHQDLNRSCLLAITQQRTELLFYNLKLKQLIITQDLTQICHIESSIYQLNWLAGCITLSYVKDKKMHFFVCNPNSGLIIRKLTFKEESMQANNRVYEVLDDKSVKEYCFDRTDTSLSLSEQVKRLVQKK